MRICFKFYWKKFLESLQMIKDMRKIFHSGKTKSLEWRRQQLEALLSFLEQERDQIALALKKDLNKVTYNYIYTHFNFQLTLSPINSCVVCSRSKHGLCHSRYRYLGLKDINVKGMSRLDKRISYFFRWDTNLHYNIFMNIMKIAIWNKNQHGLMKFWRNKVIVEFKSPPLIFYCLMLNGTISYIYMYI